MTVVVNIWIVIVYVYSLSYRPILTSTNFFFIDRGSRDIFNNLAPASPALPPIGGNVISEKIVLPNPSLEMIPIPVNSNINPSIGLLPVDSRLPPINFPGLLLSDLPTLANTNLVVSLNPTLSSINNLDNSLIVEPLSSISTLSPINAISISDSTKSSIVTPIPPNNLINNNVNKQPETGTISPLEILPIRAISILEQTNVTNSYIETTTLISSVENKINNETENVSMVNLLPINVFQNFEQIPLMNPSLDNNPSVDSMINNPISLPTALPPIKELATFFPPPTNYSLESTTTLSISSSTSQTTTMPINRKGIPISSWTQSPPIICPCGCFIKRLRNALYGKKYKKDYSQCFRKKVLANVENHLIDCPCGCVITTSSNTTVSIYPSRRKCLGKLFTSSVDKQRITCHCGCSGKTKENINYIIHPDNNCDCDRELNAEDCKYRKLFRIMEENLQS